MHPRLVVMQMRLFTHNAHLKIENLADNNHKLWKSWLAGVLRQRSRLNPAPQSSWRRMAEGGGVVL